MDVGDWTAESTGFGEEIDDLDLTDETLLLRCQHRRRHCSNLPIKIK
jgi:hypothetical protein